MTLDLAPGVDLIITEWGRRRVVKSCPERCACKRRNSQGFTLRDWLILDGAEWARRTSHVTGAQTNRVAFRAWRSGKEPNRTRFCNV